MPSDTWRDSSDEEVFQSSQPSNGPLPRSTSYLCSSFRPTYSSTFLADTTTSLPSTSKPGRRQFPPSHQTSSTPRRVLMVESPLTTRQPQSTRRASTLRQNSSTSPSPGGSYNVAGSTSMSGSRKRQKRFWRGKRDLSRCTRHAGTVLSYLANLDFLSSKHTQRIPENIHELARPQQALA